MAAAVSLPLRLGLAACALALAAWTLPERPAVLRTIQVHDNRLAAGTRRDDLLVVDLEVARGTWYPDADDGPSIEMLAFGEAGGPLQIPSPLIRVREGTTIRARVHNTLTDSTIVVHGLMTRPGSDGDSLVVPPGETRVAEFLAGEPGTYMYAANLAGNDVGDRTGSDSQLGGALIVDRAGAAPDDRVFVMGMWAQFPDSAHPDVPPRDIMVINGKSWPHTERLEVPLGDTVTWRWVNPTNSSHPMHLHGFYFELTSRGDWLRDTTFAAAERPRMVTELMLPGNTMTMRWAPSQPGNWIFHCHFAFHVSPIASLTGNLALEAAERGDSSGLPHAHTAETAMNGLVMGITVPVPLDWTPPEPVAMRRDIRLLIQTAPRRFGDSAGYGFVIPDGAEPARDSIEIPGPMLVLERGEPVRITTVNNLQEPTGVHWHG
ncbi:MAG: multicopper oxidase domain-containing protein, partial [Gemmatimonadota bacterium]|nr:multicopper oxidase domain-containing protein [Gemmatimonadota bacterium]